MPIYEYLCPQCRHLFEEWTKSAQDSAPEPCPRCGASAPRVISQTSFVLKGDGWYVSDYGYRKGVKEDGEVAAEPTESAEKSRSQADATEAATAVDTDATQAKPAQAKDADTQAKPKRTSPPPAAPARRDVVATSRNSGIRGQENA